MRHTKKELRDLALRAYGGNIFTDRHIQGNEEQVSRDLKMIFMPLAFMDQDALDEFKSMKPAMLYCPISEAAPRSANGYPIFFTMYWLDEEDLPIYNDFLQQLEAFANDDEEADNQQEETPVQSMHEPEPQVE